MKILAVGGGSGGHVTPVAAVLKELATQKVDEPLDVLFVCDKGFLPQSQGIMKDLPFPVTITTVPSGKLRRYAHFSWWHYLIHFTIVLQNLADLVKTLIGFFKASWLIMRFRHDVMFAKGGFVCLPMGYAAKLFKVPIVIHDSDVRPGLTNKLLARFASAIGTGMPLENYPYNPQISTYVGVPISSSITPVTPEMQVQYRKDMDLPVEGKLVVAVGGGLGSVAINSAAIEVARTSGDTSTTYCNVTGVKNIDQARKDGKGIIAYHPIPFVYQDMHKLLGAADVVVTRASATTLQELAGLGKAVIAVPAQQLGDQQRNAKLFSQYDAVVSLQDSELASRLAQTLDELLSDEAYRTRLAKNLHTFARPSAAHDMARIIIGVAR